MYLKLFSNWLNYICNIDQAFYQQKTLFKLFDYLFGLAFKLLNPKIDLSQLTSYYIETLIMPSN